MSDGGAPVVRLETWSGPWDADDSDANLKADIAAHSLLDPLQTLGALSREAVAQMEANRGCGPARSAPSGNGRGLFGPESGGGGRQVVSVEL
jgi:hypothetical protein